MYTVSKKYFITESQLSTIVNETKYTDIMKTLRGLRKSIKTIAILTASNPYGVKETKEYNTRANKDLEGNLKTGFFGYKKISGKYGHEEDSFIVNNISRSIALSFGEKFAQDSVIYGEVDGIENDNVYMRFEMLSTDPRYPKDIGNLKAESDVVINLNDPEDYYSEIGGKKFVIPFYDVTDRFVDKNDKPYKVISNYSGSTWDGGKVEPKSSEIVYEESIISNKLNELNKIQDKTITQCCSAAYNNRGLINRLIKEIEDML